MLSGIYRTGQWNPPCPELELRRDKALAAFELLVDWAMAIRNVDGPAETDPGSLCLMCDLAELILADAPRIRGYVDARQIERYNEMVYSELPDLKPRSI